MIGQPPGITGNRGTLNRALVLVGDGYYHRRLQAAGLIRRGFRDDAIMRRTGLTLRAVLEVRRSLRA